MNDLIVNPSAKLHLLVHCRVRGRGPVEVTVPIAPDALSPDDARVLFALLAHGAGGAVPEGLPRAIADELAAAGVFVAASDAVSELPTYACVLDAELTALMPAPDAARARAEPLAATLEASREIVLEHDALDPGAPSQTLVGAAEALAPERPLLWVRDPGPQSWMPFVLAESIRREVLQWLAGERAASALPGDTARVLRAAGVLGAPGFCEARAAQWEAQLALARRQLADEGFAVVRGLVNPVQLAAMRRYMRALHDAGAFTVCDTCVELRDWIHNEEVARFVHHQLVPTINRLVPDAVKPSYAYLAMYHPRARLERHTDRKQCQWNVSMPLDTAPETDRASAWPIYLETHGRVHEVRLGMGDIVLYRGTETPHWRDAQPAGQRCTVCFFHFVAQDFDGALD